MNFLITGGGTGGHLAIAKAFGEELESRGEKAVYVGSTKGQDRLWFEDSSIFKQCYFLQTTGVVNQKGLAKCKALFAQLKAIKQIKEIFKIHSIDVVISVGGFSAGPASIGAILFRKPLFIHEQNAIKGRLNQILSPFAKKTFCSFDTPFVPYPLKKQILESKRIRTKLETIIFIGGSQGAKAINDLALEVAPILLQKGKRIIHQCGDNDLERVKTAYKAQGILEQITLFGFSTEILTYLNQADLCVGRAGASSVWENAALGLPMLYIPYPYAAKNHQVYNAQYFVKENLGEMILQKDISTERFFAYIDSMSEKLLQEISSKLCDKISQNGASVIIDMIVENLS